MLTCGYPLHRVNYGRRNQCIPLRRAFHSINPLRTPLAHQLTVPLEGLSLQLQPPVHSVNSLRERVTYLWTAPR